jgi:sigma-B regulation protein RsbU (phosphoserine phosphatase)
VIASKPGKILVIPGATLWEELFPTPLIAKKFLLLLVDRFRARSEAMHAALEHQLRYEHVQRELGIAREIQLGMLPVNPDLGPEVDIAVDITPAQHVGGDFGDVFALGPEEYCVVVGDVSGKGVPAALFLVHTMTLLRPELRKDQSLGVAIGRLNALLCHEDRALMFAPLVVGILNTRTGNFRYLNAGHDPMLHAERGLTWQTPAPPRGILVGLDEGATYEVASLNLGVKAPPEASPSRA